MSFLLTGLLLAAGAAQPIRQVDFRNFTYETCFDEDPALVKNGIRERSRGPLDGGPTHFSIDDQVYGDLDGDGRDEAVISTLCSGGGTGKATRALVFAMRGNRPVLIATTESGDRANGGLHRVTIAAGRLHVARYGGNGGACCPQYIETQRYRLTAGNLVPDGAPLRNDYVSRHSTQAVRRIQFPAASSSTTVHGATTEDERFLIAAQAGQTMYLYVGGVNTALEFSGGTKAWKSQPKVNEEWVVRVPDTGDYELSVSAATRGKPATFSITIEIR